MDIKSYDELVKKIHYEKGYSWKKSQQIVDDLVLEE